MSKSTTVSCTRDVKTQFEKFLSKAMESFTTKLMAEDDEDTTEDHIKELLSECFSTSSFKVVRATGKTKRAKSTGPKAPSNAYIQWSNAEGRVASQKMLEKPHLKKLKKMSDAELAEAYDGETDKDKILKKLVSSKDIISNAAKMWKEHKEAEDDTFKTFQAQYEEQRKAFQKLKAEAASNDDEAGPADAASNTDDEEDPDTVKTKASKSKGGGKKTKAGGKKSKSNSSEEDTNSSNEEVEVKTYNLKEFDTFDGLKINIGMTVRGGFNTKFKKETFDSLEDAVDAMNEDEDAMSIHLDKKGKYTVRSSATLVEAKTNQAPCVTWVKEEDEDSD